MELSQDQQQAFAQIDEFLNHPFDQVFTLHGDAGTGKSTLLAAVAKRYRNAQFCAPTNKAASNLIDKINRSASTIHSLIFTPEPILNHEGKQTGLDWIDKEYQGRLVLVDEACMVEQWVAEKLIDKSDKLIAFGDPGQLPPVRGRRAFTAPNFRLTENHRQAAGSGIINQALAVRRGESYQTDREFVVCATADDFYASIDRADMILAYRNETRRFINNVMRQVRGRPDTLTAGEPIICRAGSKDRRVFSGQILTVAADWEPGQKLEVRELDKAIWATVEGFDPSYDEKDKPVWMACMAPAYCITVHNAQGSEFRRITIIDEMHHDERRAWLYTAITRAQEQAHIWRCR